MTKLLKAAARKADAADAPPRRAGKKERTRQEIYRTAMRLFAEDDYDKVTIEDICAGAGVAKATFFLHFAGKAALITAFNEEITQAMSERLAEHKGTAEEQLFFIASVFEEAWRDNATVMRKMLSEYMDQPAKHLVATDLNKSVIDLVSSILRRGQERGEFRPGFTPEVGAAAIVATWSAITAWWQEHPETDTSTFNREFLDIALNGLKAKPEGRK
ncbi:transcriptional regulator, TetR family [Parvibaculum lavamentivorans DS-1]|uniref:Transcriptional regulator, TetR family n=1 Tax=Parvibaculum lavamentivorans (strain DS-1 / DSM 13023 / NCIMB 13966) TaxID=402881 RepID=A7HTN3_PARL1|nr:TetR/AcrR family transcriptional regulator [Parvibaculum lavamentivorans]ABS63266.1 transcriptional regulator, TetR family [Parvibaculum lavamentivorans DS-1]